MQFAVLHIFRGEHSQAYHNANPLRQDTPELNSTRMAI